MRVLIVEDDPTIREALRLTLERERFAVDVADDGPSGLAQFFSARPDLVVLDLGLPGLDGTDVCRTIRTSSIVPIVMLTARSDSASVVAGLEAGADDYIAKPFEPHVLVARLRAVMRRASREPDSTVLTAGDLQVDVAGAQVMRAGVEIALTPTEYQLLVDLMRHAGIVRTRDDLLQSVWDYSWRGDTRLVDVHVQRLRAKVGAGAIETVRGQGYKLAKG